MQCSRTYLADILEDVDGAPEIPHMEDWQLQVYVTIVTYAFSQSLATRLTLGILLAYPL